MQKKLPNQRMFVYEKQRDIQLKMHRINDTINKYIKVPIYINKIMMKLSL